MPCAESTRDINPGKKKKKMNSPLLKKRFLFLIPEK